MTEASPNNLQIAIQQTIHFLEQEGFSYFILGGVAVGVLGESRFTYDLDIDIFLQKSDIDQFLSKAHAAGFHVDREKVLKDAAVFGTFRISWKQVPVDFIVASTQLEQDTLSRSVSLPICGEKARFPSPEDLILLKLYTAT